MRKYVVTFDLTHSEVVEPESESDAHSKVKEMLVNKGIPQPRNLKVYQM